jgi:hypothetical protein
MAGGRPRLPNDVAKITGAVAKNAGRFKDRFDQKEVKSLGPAPPSFDEEQRAIWDAFNADFPWLGRADRSLVKMAVMMDQMVDSGEAPVSVFAQYRLLLSSMGGTPVDRSKVSAPEEKDEDPADQFFQ